MTLQENLLADLDISAALGVWMQATASQVWRATGGKFNSEFFKYKIGGEW